MNRQQIYPDSSISDGFKKDLLNNFPEALLVFHPVQENWQLYECRNSAWDALRLFNAIVAYYSSKEPVQPEDSWWNWRGAPSLIHEGLPFPPGDWLLELIGQEDFHRYPGGPKEWYREMERRYFKKLEQKKEKMHENHLDMAKSGLFRHARDFQQGDPLAGKRKWVHTVGIDLK